MAATTTTTTTTITTKTITAIVVVYRHVIEMRGNVHLANALANTFFFFESKKVIFHIGVVGFGHVVTIATI